MILIDIIKKNNRINNKAKKIPRDRITGKEERKEINKGYSSDKGGDFGNRSGLYYRLSKKKQKNIISIIAALEKEIEVMSP